MSNAAFLSLVFGGLLFIVVISTILLFKRPHQASFAGAMTVLGLCGASGVISKTGSYWCALGVVALAAVSYFMLQQLARHSLHRSSNA